MPFYHGNLGLNFTCGIVVSHHYAGLLASKEANCIKRFAFHFLKFVNMP